jgi:hypothetical protein
MKKISIVLVALAVAAVFTSSASATPITGTLAVTGSNETWTSTQVSFSSTPGNATVAIAPATSGSLAAAIGDDVTFTTNPLVFSTALGKELFSTGDGITFTITSLTVDLDNGTFLDLNGSGTMTENGFNTTVVGWSLSTTSTSGSTTFGLDVGPGVGVVTPEPSGLLLLGSGLFGLAFVAFRKTKSSGLVLQS